MSPSNSLIDWIIRNRADYIAQGLQGSSAFANQVEFEGNTINDLAQNSSIDQVDQDELNTSLALNPLLQNWFSVQKPTSFVSCKYEVFKMLFLTTFLILASSSQPTATSSQEKSSFPSNLYQNLYYYAIQQQISASLACNPSDDNFVDQNNTSDLGAIQSKIVKCKNFNVKRPISATVVSPSPRKRPSAAKPKKMNQVVLKKAKNAKEALANQAIPSGDLGKIEEVELDLSLRNDLNWTTESSECKCDINDEQEDGVNSCGAKSKCKKLRRNRTVFTELQLMGLERRFDSQKYLSTPDRYTTLNYLCKNNH